MKRLFDLVVAVPATLVSLPLIAVVALVVLCTGGRPLLHRDPRVGRGGTTFELLKFRTLAVGDAPGRSIAPEDDPRITPAGRWLRRWRLDEFPQLVNVLRGELSLVGPRPLSPAHAAAVPPAARAAFFSLRPGITSPASIAFLAEDAVLAGRADAEAVFFRQLLPARIEMELGYIRQRNLLTDLRIVARTLRLLWSREQRRLSAAMIRDILARAPEASLAQPDRRRDGVDRDQGSPGQGFESAPANPDSGKQNRQE